jgi:hypothetical protein
VSLNVLVKYQSCVKPVQRNGRMPVDVMGALGERMPIGGDGQMLCRDSFAMVWERHGVKSVATDSQRADREDMNTVCFILWSMSRLAGALVPVSLLIAC